MNIAKPLKSKDCEKLKKQLERTIERSIKPNECLKLLTVFIDNSIREIEGSSDFLETLVNFEGPTILFEDIVGSVSNYSLNYSVRFVLREDRVVSDDSDENQWRIESLYNLDDQIIMIIPAIDFIRMVNKESNSLNMLSIEELLRMIDIARVKVTIFLIGIDHELMRLKASKSKPSKINAKYIDDVLLDLNLRHKITTFKLNNFAEAANIAICYCKSIAQTYIKTQSNEKSDQLYGFTLNNGSSCCVTATISGPKNLGGVDELWRNQLMQFRGVTTEMADAIRSRFPTPRHFYDSIIATVNTHGEKEAISSIADIEVRRGTDILANKRRVGVEISTRIYRFITANQDVSGSLY